MDAFAHFAAPAHAVAHESPAILDSYSSLITDCCESAERVANLDWLVLPMGSHH